MWKGKYIVFVVRKTLMDQSLTESNERCRLDIARDLGFGLHATVEYIFAGSKP